MNYLSSATWIIIILIHILIALTIIVMVQGKKIINRETAMKKYEKTISELNEENINIKKELNELKIKEEYVNKTKTEIENEILKERIKEYYHNDI